MCVIGSHTLQKIGRHRRYLQVRALSAQIEMCDVDDVAPNGDLVISGMNPDSDVLVRVISCREMIQDLILKNNLSPDASKSLAEVLMGVTLMGAGLKAKESLQVNIVGSDPNTLRNIICITDGECVVRGRVGNPQFTSNLLHPSIHDLLGDAGGGQVQVVRDHPSYKHAMSGFTDLRPISLTSNLALYMHESEQRKCVLVTDVGIEGGILCRHALSLLVEFLPGAEEDNISKVEQAIQRVESRGLRSYYNDNEINDKDDDVSNSDRHFSIAPVIHRILGDCLQDVGGIAKKWTKRPTFQCTCSLEKVWRTLQLLPIDEIQDIITTNDGPVSVKCEFCGSAYSVPLDDIQRDILDLKKSGSGSASEDVN